MIPFLAFMSRSVPPASRDILVPLIAALLAAERRIAMLERRLYDARWVGPGEEPNVRDKAVAMQRVKESLGGLYVAEEELDDL